jgi:RNA polymerase sigma-70 factor (ECF subfamily)
MLIAQMKPRLPSLEPAMLDRKALVAMTSEDLPPGADSPPKADLGQRSDADLISALRAGDRSAANQLVDRSYEMIYASLFKLTGGDQELAADLTQDAYARAWRSLDRFSGRSQFSTWLYRIAYNTFLNHIRRPARIRAFEEGEEAVVASSAPGIAESLAARQEREQLRRAVLELPDELRLVVSARYWGGLSVQEIAEMENLTTVGIRKRLKRAYAALERRLAEASV